MKAVLLKGYGGVDQFVMETVPTPSPGAGEVLVRIRASGVCNHDVLARQGHFPRTKIPGIIGHEFAGEVAEVGPGVSGFSVRDRVAVAMKDFCGHCPACLKGRDNLCERAGGLFGEEIPGGYAEYISVRTNVLLRIPDGVTFEEAAIVPCALGTAYHGLHAVGKVQPGETVVITGATGGVGAHAVQVARMLGARVIAVTTSDAKIEFLRSNGADDVIVSPQLDFSKEVRRLTGGAGADLVFNIVGSIAWEAALRSTAFGGRQVLIGNVNAAPVTLRPAQAILKEMFLLGTFLVTRSEIETLFELTRLKRLRPVVGTTMPLAEIREAHQLMEARSAVGRIVLTA